MKDPKPSFSVNVDVTNPGQFFACCGLLELAHRLWPGAEGWFEGDRFNVLLQELEEEPMMKMHYASQYTEVARKPGARSKIHTSHRV